MADTYMLLWTLKCARRERSPNAAHAVDRALAASTAPGLNRLLPGSAYLVDPGRLLGQVFGEARSIVDGDAFTVVPLDLSVLEYGGDPEGEGARPFGRLIAATALTFDLPLVSADEEDIRRAVGEWVVW